MIKGTGVSGGYGRGRAVIIKSEKADFSHINYLGENEEGAFKTAVDRFVEETRRMAERLKTVAGKTEAQILEGQICIVNDTVFQSRVTDMIFKGKTAGEAVDSVLSDCSEALKKSGDEIMRLRAEDINDIKNRLLGIICNGKNEKTKYAKGSIIVVRELTPSMISGLNGGVEGVIAESGGYTSHSAILLRAMGIPAVFFASGATKAIKNGDYVVVDGDEGIVITEPQSGNYPLKRVKKTVEKTDIVSRENSIKVYGNISSPKEVKSVIENGGEGIGLFRTEYLFTQCEPSEEEQFRIYSEAAKLMKGREVIIRTVDFGGDKRFKPINIKRENNPMLGERGIRFCLKNTDIFKRQLRALLRAASLGNIKIMLPMVSVTDEIKRTKALIEECEKELEDEGLQFGRAPLGIMIETPSAALASDSLAREADFFSIGTNDLTGYIMAVDRDNRSGLYNVLQPAVLRAIETAVKNAKAQGISVGICGEAAAESGFTEMLIDWGVDVVSVAPLLIQSTKKNIKK